MNGDNNAEEASIEEIINSLDENEENSEKSLENNSQASLAKNNVVSIRDLENSGGSKELDVTDQDELAEELVNMVKDDRNKADEVFDMYYPKIATDKDRSEASKEGLTKALELKIEASKNIIELMKVKAKAEQSGTNIGIMLSGIPAKKAGIDMNVVRDVADDEN
jgi:hypothetical protein